MNSRAYIVAWTILAGCTQITVIYDDSYSTGGTVDVVGSDLKDSCSAAASDAGDPELVSGITAGLDCVFTESNYSQAPEGWPAGTCFHGHPPQAGDFVAPMPADLACDVSDYAPKFWPSGSTIPQPDLQLELGRTGDHGESFVPLSDGDFLAVIHGAQGALMSLVRMRVQLPGQTACLAKLQSRLVVFINCMGEAMYSSPYAWAEQDEQGLYQASKHREDIYVIYTDLDPAKSWQLCGQIGDFLVQVRVPDTDHWGQVHRRLRLYDTPKNTDNCGPSSDATGGRPKR